MKAETLKKAILQYAMEGKLVAQDPNDEPASELLKRIKAEKEQLIKDGNLKKEKPLPPITEEEIPFELPYGWEFERLGNILDIARGGSPRPIQAFLTSDENGLNWIKIGDTQKGYKYIDSAKEKIIKEGLSKTRFVKKGDFLLSNSMSFGRPYILNIDGCIHDGWLVLSKVEKCFDKDFLYYVLSSPYLFSQFCGSVSGAVVKNLNSEKVANAVVYIPPLEEQKRIVEKLEEILPLVEEYGKNEEKLSKLNETLPKKIRQSILQHAVQGKLVQQNPNDEPASELLKRIKAEKEQLIKDGKLKKEKPLPPITEEEIPYELPQSWEWVRLGEILNKLTDGAHSTPKYVKKGIPFLSVKDISSGKISFENTKFITQQEHNELYKRCNPQIGDILLTKVGTTGIPVIVDTNQEFSLFVSVALLKFNNKYIDAEFLKYIILSPLVQSQCSENTKGVGNKNWVIKDIANTLIAIPPLEEQKRIVAKVDELMQIIEILK